MPEITRVDIIDAIEQYAFFNTATHVKGHKITYQAVAIDDIYKALDELSISRNTVLFQKNKKLTVNCYVWHKERIYRLINFLEKEKLFEIFDIETRKTLRVQPEETSRCY